MSNLKIVASEPLKKKTLEVEPDGIRFHESAGFGMGETEFHPFADVDAVVRCTDEPLLSIQIGKSVWSIRYNHQDEKQRAVADAIVAGASAVAR